MRKLKLFFACLLMAVLSIGQVWANKTIVFTVGTENSSTAATINTSSSDDVATLSVSSCYARQYGMWMSSNNNAATATLTMKTAGQVKASKIVTTLAGTMSKEISIQVTYTDNSTSTKTGLGTATGDTAYALDPTKTIKSIQYTAASKSKASISQLVIHEASGSTEPTLSLNPTSASVAATDVANQSVALTASNFASAISSVTTGLYSDAQCNTAITSGQWVKDIIVNAGKTAVTFNVDDNDGAQRQCWLKITASDGTGNASAILPITQALYVAPPTPASLPFSFTGGRADIATTNGITHEGLGTDYNGVTTKLKFDGTGDNVIINFNAAPGTLSFDIKGNSFSGGTFKVQESADGNTYTDKYTYSEDGTGVEVALSSAARYVKFIYVTKSSGNIGLGNIAISAYVAPAAVAAPTISGTESFVTSTTVTLDCTTNGATIYYTTDGSDPKTSGTKQTYSAPFNLTANTTVRAIANKGSDWSNEATPKTFTKITPLTVAQAIAAIPNKDDVVNDQYVAGIVCTAAPSLLSGGKLTYYISADGSETDRLQIYKGKNLNNTEFTAVSDLAIGDRVTVFGQLKNYNNTPEMNDGNYLVSKETPAVVAPVFSPDGGGFMGETNVTITCATGSSNIYYTTDGSTTPSKSSTPYTEPIHLNATTTIKAIAYVGEESSLVVTKTFTLTAPMTVAEALAALENDDPINNAAVVGIISTAPASNPSSGKLTYYISDDGTNDDELEVYKGFGVAGASFSDKTDLQVGDEVTVFGNLTIYNTTKEFAEGSRLLEFNRPQVDVESISLTESTAEVEEGKTVTLHASVLPVNATNKTIVWSVESGNDKASVADGVVSGIAAGTAVIRATSDEDATIFAECTVTVTAPTPLSPWASVYTSNVEIASNTAAHVTINEEDFDAAKTSKGASATITLPQGVTTIHLHLVAWSGEAQTVSVTGACFNEAKELTIVANDGVSGSGTTYDLGASGTDYYFSLTPDNDVAANTVITISAASNKRFVLFGVNAVYPAAITLDPTSKDFGEVKENANAQFEFTITPNAMSTGDLVASIIGTDAAKFSASAISENKVTVTFTPGEVGGPYSASLKVESGNAEVTAALSGTGITSATPEIGIDKTEVAFGNVEQNTTPATQSVAVTLSNIDEDGVSAAISGSAFTLNTNKLTADGSIVITPVTTTPGVYSETLTLSATGATSKNVTVTMTVVDEWAYVYTSNVDIDSDTPAQVTIGETNYAAAKTSKGSSATITLPQGVTKIHMHLVAWKGEAQTVTISGDYFDEDKEIVIIANDGVSGSGTTYPLGASGVDYYCSLTPDKAVAANTEITIATEGQKRFVLFGVNQEGGIVPVLDHIEISGDLTMKSGYKTGDDLDLDGLTVEAVYTLGGVEQSPVDITNDPGLTLTYDPLVVDQTEVTITATYEDKSDDIVITLDEAVVSGEPVIITDVNSRTWTSVDQYTTPATKTVTVTLKNVAAAKATLGGTNPEVFSINKTDIANGDVITISVNTENAGSFAATLTISDKATENPAADKVVNLSLTVEEAELPEATVGTFTRWIEATEIKDGMEVLIVGVNNTDYYAMGVQTNNNRTAVQGSVVDGVFSPGANTMSFTLVAQGDGTYAIRTSTGKYLYAAASGSNYLRTQAAVDDNAKWTLTLTSAVAESSSNRNVMQFNSGSSIFSCYGTASQKAIKFYVRKADYERNVTEGRIGTICLPKAGVMAGASLFQIAYMDYESDGVTPHKIYFDELPSNEMIAGRPYIFLPNEGASKLGVYYTSDETASAGHLNGLYGTLTEMNTADASGDDLMNNFIFSNNLFYLVNSSTVRLQANRAYVKACDELPGWSNPGYVPSLPAPGLRRIGIGGEAPQVTTGMENVQTDDAQTTKVLINGQFFILRGEKMYDATGRLVK